MSRGISRCMRYNTATKPGSRQCCEGMDREVSRLLDVVAGCGVADGHALPEYVRQVELRQRASWQIRLQADDEADTESDAMDEPEQSTADTWPRLPCKNVNMLSIRPARCSIPWHEQQLAQLQAKPTPVLDGIAIQPGLQDSTCQNTCPGGDAIQAFGMRLADASDSLACLSLACVGHSAASG